MITRDPQILTIDFEDLYTVVSRLEKRVYSDEQVSKLPDISSVHIHAEEWKQKKRTCARLINYLTKKGRSLRILDAGSGNGWLAAKLAEIPGSDVIGVDINQAEINQANRVFEKDNLEFIYDTFNDDTFTDLGFDVIIFSASLQYFPSVKLVLDQALSLLNEDGEVHIIGTSFYKSDEIAKADERTRKYYHALGYPQMAEYYFHHSIDELSGLRRHILLNPNSIMRLLDKRGPFHWITVNQ